MSQKVAPDAASMVLADKAAVRWMSILLITHCIFLRKRDEAKFFIFVHAGRWEFGQGAASSKIGHTGTLS